MSLSIEEQRFGILYLETIKANFASQKALADGALRQLSEDEFYDTLSSSDQRNSENNSIAILIKHLHGNMRSRWQDFLNSDGEKPFRDRDDEFELEPRPDKDTLLSWWNEGWETLFAALAEISPADLTRNVYIRKQPLMVLEAIERQVCHYSNHIGQIVFIAKYLKGEDWQTLSIAKGASKSYDPAQHQKGHYS